MKQILPAFGFAFLVYISSFVSAQDTFTDPALWQAAICGTVIDDDFDSLANGQPVGADIVEYPSPQTLEWGTLSGNNPTLLGALNIVSGINSADFGFEVSPGNSLVFTPDATNGNLEGFCFEHLPINAPFSSGTVTIFDGATVIASFNLETGSENLNPGEPFSISVPATSSFCWLNANQANVTSIEYTDNFSSVTSLISAQFAFGDGCDPPAETLLLQIENVINDLDAIGPTGSNKDDNKIACALFYLDSATDESLWDGDQVTSCDFFKDMKKASNCLTSVSGIAAVDQALEDIQAILSGVVDSEIAAAEAAGGNANDIATAQYYQGLADSYQSVGDYKKACKYRKWAWQEAAGSY